MPATPRPTLASAIGRRYDVRAGQWRESPVHPSSFRSSPTARSAAGSMRFTRTPCIVRSIRAVWRFWSAAFAAGASRAQIAEDIFTAPAAPGAPSNEYRMVLIDTYYMLFLGRSPDPGSPALGDPIAARRPRPVGDCRHLGQHGVLRRQRVIQSPAAKTVSMSWVRRWPVPSVRPISALGWSSGPARSSRGDHLSRSGSPRSRLACKHHIDVRHGGQAPRSRRQRLRHQVVARTRCPIR